MSAPDEAAERRKLAVIFFIQAHAGGIWTVAMSAVLRAHGHESLVPLVFACTSLAAIVAPLALAALADQRFSANQVLRWLAVGNAFLIALNAFSIERGWPSGVVLGLMQTQALCGAPMWGLASAIVFARLRHPSREFGSIRVWGTLGWMAAGAFTSFVLQADRSTRAGFAASLAWLIVATYTFWLPTVPPLARGGPRPWRDILGLSALSLLAHRDHRVVFLTTALFSIPLAAYFPFTALHLADLGVEKISAALALGQITEILAMLSLGWLLTRLRLKWVFVAGIAFGLLRFLLFTHGTVPALIAGIMLHGLCFTLFFITLQIYLEQRVPPEWRSRAQSLVTVTNTGLGTLLGSLGGGWWREACRIEGAIDWTRFWFGEAAVIAAVLVFFLAAYRGVHAPAHPEY